MGQLLSFVCFTVPEIAYGVHGDLLLLRQFFFSTGACFVSHARALLAEAMARSKRCPKNFNSSSPERNRSSVQESTSSTQPSNWPSAGLVSGPSWTTNAPRIVV